MGDDELSPAGLLCRDATPHERCLSVIVISRSPLARVRGLVTRIASHARSYARDATARRHAPAIAASLGQTPVEMARRVL